jgi:hypothetical protein
MKNTVFKFRESPAWILESDSLYQEVWQKVFKILDLFEEQVYFKNAEELFLTLPQSPKKPILIIVDEKDADTEKLNQLIAEALKYNPDSHFVFTSFLPSKLIAYYANQEQVLVHRKPYIIDYLIKNLVKLLKL